MDQGQAQGEWRQGLRLPTRLAGRQRGVQGSRRPRPRGLVTRVTVRQKLMRNDTHSGRRPPPCSSSASSTRLSANPKGQLHPQSAHSSPAQRRGLGPHSASLGQEP